VALDVAVRQQEHGKTDQGIHILELRCVDGDCSLTSISLNQCSQSGDGRPAFYPRVQQSSTLEGNLAVGAQGRTLIVKESGADFGGDYVNNFRFEYAPPRAGRAATELLSFSGGFVKNSAFLGKVVTVDYVPLPKPFQVVALDCGVLLPGIQAK